MALPLPVSCIFLLSVFASVESQGDTPHLLECRHCRNAMRIEDCRETQLCSHNEECYMDSILTPQMQTVFNGGCRSRTVCNAGADHTGKRAVTDHVICSSCCNTTKSPTTTECNANLCGIKSGRHLNQCYYCGVGSDARQGAVTDPRTCRQIKSCADDEVCTSATINRDGVITHEFGCQQLIKNSTHDDQTPLLSSGINSAPIPTLPASTDNLNNRLKFGAVRTGVNTGVDVQHLSETGELLIGRKRQINVCDICCGDGLCNDDECKSVRRRLATFAKAGRLNYTTLRIM